MAIYLKNLTINSFRGLNNVNFSAFNHVNLILGDNNSGKTSLLEIISILSNLNDFNNILRTTQIRRNKGIHSVSVFESFKSMFSTKTNKIGFLCDTEIGSISFLIKCEEVMLEVVKEDLINTNLNIIRRKYDSIIGTMQPTLVGNMKININNSIKDMPIKLSSISRTVYPLHQNNNIINVVYLSPVSHLTENVFNNIIKIDEYKEICVELLRLFDPNIYDMVYLKNELTGFANEYLKHKELDLIPLSSFGDGIKKVLSIANAIISAKNGILLIDEIDTSIHSDYYLDVFNFLIKTALKFNVQLFITTHNIEAIDKMLETQSYNEQETRDDLINVITLRKKLNGEIKIRNLNGKEAQLNRELFDGEVRK